MSRQLTMRGLHLGCGEALRTRLREIREGSDQGGRRVRHSTGRDETRQREGRS